MMPDVGIRDRDYLKDWRPPDDWEPSPTNPGHKKTRRIEILAWIGLSLLVVAIVVAAIFG